MICDEVVEVSSPEAAELTKLLENIFRSVNIALVNELAQLCDRMGIDVWEVDRRRGHQAVRLHALRARARDGRPLPPGGPVLPRVQGPRARLLTEFIELAGKLNQAQPQFCVERIERTLNDARKPVRGSRILVLGVAYKAGVGDMRESPAVKIARELRELGAEVAYHDPHVPSSPSSLCARRAREELGGRDIACIVTAQPEVDYERVVARGGAGARLPRRDARHRSREPGPAVRLGACYVGTPDIAVAPTG